MVEMLGVCVVATDLDGHRIVLRDSEKDAENEKPIDNSRWACRRPFLVAGSRCRSSGVKVGFPRYAAGTPL